jgi:iron complex transport system permease protein
LSKAIRIMKISRQLRKNIGKLPAQGIAGLLAILCIVALLAGLSIGSVGLEPLWGLRFEPVAMQIIWDVRAPRTLGALLTGGLLGLAGAIAQGLFRNPLADPFLLGSSSGAAFGVAVILAGFGISPLGSQWLIRLGLTGAAFIGAMLAVLLTLSLARGVQYTLRLLLAGVVVGVVLGALTSLLSLTRPEILQSMQSFTLGSTAHLGWSACTMMAVVLSTSLAVSIALSRGLDGLALGEATALSLGLPLTQLRGALIGVIALATGTAVANTGLIAFVGLAAPHIVRTIVNVRYAWLLPLAGLMGAFLLSLADLLARGLIAPQELPVGVLTGILGGGYLMWLMNRRVASHD